MKEQPILFRGPMVRAILRRQKYQTRRVVEGQPARDDYHVYHRPDGRFIWVSGPVGQGVGVSQVFDCPYGVPGDRLWVRETTIKTPAGVAYAADGADHFGAGGRLKQTPSIFMPRAVCRIVLEVTATRIERLQVISHEDTAAEGIEDTRGGFYACRDRYAALWDSIHRPGAWKSNPWVWVITFKRIES